MIKIPLTQGKFALIDDCDYLIVSLFKWYAYRFPNIFYAVTKIKLNNKWTNLSMHRLILNAKLHEQTDHRDRNGLNNQRYNIRKCNHSQNMMNSKSHKGSSSKYKGVAWHKREKKWMAQIKVNNKQTHLGYFNLEVEAGRAYDKKAKELHGEFVRLNFPTREEN